MNYEASNASKLDLLRCLTNISSKNVFDLLLLKPPLDDQSSRPVNAAIRSQLSEQELSDMLVLPLHSLANVGNVGENGLFVAFP